MFINEPLDDVKGLKISKKVSNELRDYLKNLFELQRATSLEDVEMVYCTKFQIYELIKYKIFYKELLLHPIVLTLSPFYENTDVIIKEIDFFNLLKEIITFETAGNISENKLSIDQLKAVIKVFRILEKKLSKKLNTNQGTH